MTRHIPRSAAVGFVAIAALLAFTGPGSAQTPDPNPNADGWHNAPFTVTFSHTGMTCEPPQRSYNGPDDANPTPLTSVCDDGPDGEPAVTLTYPFKYDETRPIADPVPERGPDANGWYNSPVQVNLRWNAAVSGPDPGNCPDSLTYSGGTETSNCRDQAGNQNSVDIRFPYDSTNPEANPVFQRDPEPSGWYRSAPSKVSSGGDVKR